MKNDVLLDRIRQGEVDLEIGENGRTALSEQPIYELRQYIQALEAGYNRQRKELKLRKKIDEAAARTIVERDLGMRYEHIKTEVGYRTPKKVECVLFGSDSNHYGNCPTCAAMIFDQKNDSCHHCGQILDWGDEYGIVEN